MDSLRDAPPPLARLLSSLMHRLPIASGTTRLGFNRLTNALFSRCGNPIEGVMLNGVRIDVDPNDYHGRILYLFGTNDPKVQAVATGLLRRGDRFLDIGANYSSIGIQMTNVVGQEGQIHLFPNHNQNSVGGFRQPLTKVRSRTFTFTASH